jgi:hypothetical protein
VAKMLDFLMLLQLVEIVTTVHQKVDDCTRHMYMDQGKEQHKNTAHTILVRSREGRSREQI